MIDFVYVFSDGQLQRDDRKQDERDGGDMQQRVPGRDWNRYSEASVHGTPSLPTELMGAPNIFSRFF